MKVRAGGGAGGIGSRVTRAFRDPGALDDRFGTRVAAARRACGRHRHA